MLLAKLHCLEGRCFNFAILVETVIAKNLIILRKRKKVLVEKFSTKIPGYVKTQKLSSLKYTFDASVSSFLE